MTGRWRSAGSSRLRAVRHGLTLAGALFTGYYVLLAAIGIAFGDAYTYWSQGAESLSGDPRVGAEGAFYYSPAFAQILAPLRALPWPAFALAWTSALLATFAWLVRGAPREWWLPLLLIAGPEILTGNIHLLIAAAVVLGFSRPAAWAFPLLTKVTPGIGVLWFLFRREWRRFGVALATTALIVLVSFAISPAAWLDWVRVLALNRDASGVAALSIPLWIRLPVAAGIVAWAAATDRRWLVPVAVLLAMPHIWIQSLSVLIAVPRLLGPRTQSAALVSPEEGLGPRLGRAAALQDAGDGSAGS